MTYILLQSYMRSVRQTLVPAFVKHQKFWTGAVTSDLNPRALAAPFQIRTAGSPQQEEFGLSKQTRLSLPLQSSLHLSPFPLPPLLSSSFLMLLLAIQVTG